MTPHPSLPQPSITATTNTYTYVTGKDWIQQITNGGTHGYTYDANGNITNDGIRTYVYNQDNRLTQVTKAGVTGQYTYNGNEQRIKKVTGGNTTVYHYDLLGNLIEETTGDGTLIVSYVYAGEQRIAQVAANNTTYYYHNDHLGTPLAVTNGSGAIVWKTAYNTFGNAAVDGGSTITNNFRFPGQYYDAESGLHYNYHRYYDPNTGRYVTSDPIGLEGKISLYLYVQNNPVNKTDFYGLFEDGWNRSGRTTGPLGHSDFPGYHCFDWTAEDHDLGTMPFSSPGRHFRSINEVMPEIEQAIKQCDKSKFERLGHQGQDYYSHYNKGYRAPFGHAWDSIFRWSPDDDIVAWQEARRFTHDILERWNSSCCDKKCN